MAESIKKIGVFRIVLIVIAGIVLVLCSLPFPEGDNKDILSQEQQEIEKEERYEERVERQLKSILQTAAGIESAEVMITWYSGTEKIIEREEIIQEEVQSEGQVDGTVAQMSSKRSETTALLTEQKDGSRVPYVLKEICPVAQGVLIVAQGELTVEKTVQISEAVQALFGIEAHKVKVLEKKMQPEG